MELIVKRSIRKKRGSDCLLENMEVSDHMISESVRVRRYHGPDASARRLYNTIALMLGDSIALASILFISESLSFLVFGEPVYRGWMAPILPMWLLGAFAARLYPGWGLGAVEELRRQTLTLVGTFVFSIVFLFWFQTAEGISRIAISIAFLFALFMIPAMRRLVKALLIKTGKYGQPVVIYGAGQEGRDLAAHLEKEKGLGYRPIAFLDDHPAFWGAHLQGIPVLGDTSLVLPEARVAILAMKNVGTDYRRHLLEGPLSYYSSVIIIADLNDLPSPWVSAVDLEGTLGLRISLNLAEPISRFVKRSVDVIATGLTAVFWIPLIGVLAGFIWLLDRHKPFISGTISGHQGHQFRAWKLRTTLPHPEPANTDVLNGEAALKAGWDHDFIEKQSGRVTLMGQVLLRFSLDEIPRLLNVFFGQMSLVGPKPLSRIQESKLDGRIQALRRRLRPGMTGMWRIAGRSKESAEHFDEIYMSRWSVWLDQIILARTFRSIVRPSSGARK